MTKNNYVGELADRFHEQIIEIDRILQFSIHGVTIQLTAPQSLKAVADYNKYKNKWEGANLPPNEKYERELHEAEDRAKFAAAQKDSGFSVIYSHAIVAIWAAIETLVEDLAVHSLLFDRKYLQNEGLKKIRISIVEYESLEDEDRMRYFVGELGRQTSAELRQGIGRFEPILAAVNLTGETTDKMRKTCFELWALRNLIVHRSGIGDKRFVQLCPWFNIKVGKKVLGRVFKIIF